VLETQQYWIGETGLQAPGQKSLCKPWITPLDCIFKFILKNYKLRSLCERVLDGVHLRICFCVLFPCPLTQTLLSLAPHL